MTQKTKLPSSLPDILLSWFSQEGRDLPWRRDRVPYHVWLAEIMLQQTRIAAVIPYYTRFLSSIPTLSDLALASEDQILKLWEGLGYYSRARNLQRAARIIADQYGGSFPRDYKDILALPGIGEYTAGAIASICFDEKTPAVDGNVLRFLSRLQNSSQPVNDTGVKHEARDQLASIYPDQAGIFTQALMEIGEVICIPGKPKCGSCPCREICAAWAAGTAEKLPVITPRPPRRKEEMTVFLLVCKGKIAIQKRPEQGLLAGMWEFPHIPGKKDAAGILQAAEAFGVQPKELGLTVDRRHVFTHIEWYMRGAIVYCQAMNAGFTWASLLDLEENYSLPAAFRKFLTGNAAVLDRIT